MTSKLLYIALIARSAFAADLTQATVEAFDRYIAATEERLEPRFRGHHFLWTDETPEWRQKLKRGVLIVQLTQGSGVVTIEGGLIQDWTGAVFIFTQIS